MQSKPLSFNDDAGLYDKMRPGYPKEVFTKLQAITGLNQGSHILEIGCGSGQATRSLVDITRHIVCVDPGENLLAVARVKFPDLTFVNSTFEDYVTDERYNLIISATAWHWVNPKVAYKKAHELLKDDGYLAVLRNDHIETDPDAFHNKADFIYKRYSNPDVMGDDQKVTDDQAVLLENQYFHVVETVGFPWEQTYTIDEYIALRNTYSDHRTMDRDKRLELEKELRDFAHRHYNDKITKHYVAVLFLARKI
ncbi:MAG TPA: class I SAM-dependent methyltransferase [Candidatus Saccharimonadales bacterium]|nr:class I SAM-dependent methyltransferase [Candidatus Saccharimonadales bacterium]